MTYPLTAGWISCYFLQKKTNKGYSKPTTQAARAQQPAVNRGKNPKSSGNSEKTVKQLLGELYADKEYLEKLMGDQGTVNAWCLKK